MTQAAQGLRHKGLVEYSSGLMNEDTGKFVGAGYRLTERGADAAWRIDNGKKNSDNV